MAVFVSHGRMPIIPGGVMRPGAINRGRSMGAVLGSELAVNGDFSSGLTSVTAVGTTNTIVGGNLVVTANDGSADRAEISVSGLTIGLTYRVIVRAKRNVGSSALLWAWTFATVPATTISSTSFIDFMFTVAATATSGVIRVYAANAGAIGDQIEIDWYSVKEVLGKRAH